MNTNEPSNIEQWLSVTEAADACGLSASHLRLLIRTGKVSGRKFGRDWFTTKVAVAAYLALGCKSGPKPHVQKS